MPTNTAQSDPRRRSKPPTYRFATRKTGLADLAEEGISHRDVKPENLFRLDDAWVIGAFGLVDYPGNGLSI
jgi:serine/threonine protein kinase